MVPQHYVIHLEPFNCFDLLRVFEVFFFLIEQIKLNCFIELAAKMLWLVLLFFAVSEVSFHLNLFSEI